MAVNYLHIQQRMTKASPETMKCRLLARYHSISAAIVIIEKHLDILEGGYCPRLIPILCRGCGLFHIMDKRELETNGH